MEKLSFNNVPFADLKNADLEVEWFKSFLASNAKAIHKNSDLDQMLQALIDFAKYSKSELDRLPSYIVRLLSKGYYKIQDEFSSHLENFKGTEINLMRKASSSLERNKRWEFVIALIFASICQSVEQGTPEPDVIIKKKNIKWALPCKVLYSEKPGKQLQTIIKGIKQIQASEYHQGIVMVNISNLINHENYFFKSKNEGEYYSYSNFEYAMSDFKKETMGIFENIKNSNANFNSIFYDKNNKRRSKAKAILWFAQVVTLVQNKPVLLTQPLMTSLNNGLFEEVQSILEDFTVSSYNTIFNN
jgi:hypothetical protein